MISKNLVEMSNFMDNMGYKYVEENLFSDGRANFEIQKHKKLNHVKMQYFTSDLTKLIEDLETNRIKYHKRYHNGEISDLIIEHKNNLEIIITQSNNSASPHPMGKSEVKFGTLGEFSLKVDNLDNSIQEWHKLGYHVLHKDEKWKYAILTDEVFVVGLHAHEMHETPVFTYFDPKMNGIISNLKDNGIKITGEDGDEMMVVAPNNQIIYLFEGKI